MGCAALTLPGAAFVVNGEDTENRIVPVEEASAAEASEPTRTNPKVTTQTYDVTDLFRTLWGPPREKRRLFEKLVATRAGAEDIFVRWHFDRPFIDASEHVHKQLRDCLEMFRLSGVNEETLRTILGSDTLHSGKTLSLDLTLFEGDPQSLSKLAGILGPEYSGRPVVVSQAEWDAHLKEFRRQDGADAVQRQSVPRVSVFNGLHAWVESVARHPHSATRDGETLIASKDDWTGWRIGLLPFVKDDKSIWVGCTLQQQSVEGYMSFDLLSENDRIPVLRQFSDHAGATLAADQVLVFPGGPAANGNGPERTSLLVVQASRTSQGEIANATKDSRQPVPAVNQTNVTHRGTVDPAARIGPYDVLKIQIAADANSAPVQSIAVRADSDGVAHLPLIGEVDVKKLSIPDAEASVAQAFTASGTLRNPFVVVTIVRKYRPQEPDSSMSQLPLGPVKLLVMVQKKRGANSASAAQTARSETWIVLQGESDSLKGQADELVVSQNGEGRTLTLTGRVKLQSQKAVLEIEAESVSFQIEAGSDDEQPQLIHTDIIDGRVHFQSGSRHSYSRLEAKQIQLTVRADTFAVQTLDARNVDSIRLPDKEKSKVQINGRALESRLRAEDVKPGGLDQLVSFNLKGVPLKTVVDRLSKASGLRFVIDKEALAQEGVTPTDPVSIELDQISVRSLLPLLLKPLRLGGKVNNSDTVVITSLVKSHGRLIPATYAVADLVVGVPERLTLDLTKGASSSLQTDIRTDSQFGEATVAFDELAELITTTVEPDSWKEAGGEGTIRTSETTLSLVIRQTQQVHEEISDLLDQIRRLRDISVALRVEVLSAPPKFEERWGIDFDFQAIAQGREQAGRPAGHPADVGGRTAMRISRLGAARLRKVSQNRPVPKITLFNGQICDLRLPDSGDQTTRLELQAVASADRRFIRMSLGLTGDGADPQSRSELPLIASGESVLLDVTGAANPLLDGEKREPAAARTMLLITGDVMVVEEEEELLGIDLK